MKGIISIGRLGEVEFVISARREQDAFAAKVMEVERLMSGHERSAVATDDLFSSLQQRAFRGEL